MKCKVGDLAWHKRPGPNYGKLVEVIAPNNGQRLPDGRMGCPEANWVVRCITGKLVTYVGDRPTSYSNKLAFAIDDLLDPIHPPKITETETTDELEGVL